MRFDEKIVYFPSEFSAYSMYFDTVKPGLNKKYYLFI